MLSVFADFHRCLNNSMSSKNLMDNQLISVQQASRADEGHTKYCVPRYEYRPVRGRQRVTNSGSEVAGRTCEIGRIGGICCKLGSTGGFLTWTRKYMTRSTYPYDDSVPLYGELIFLW